MTESNILLEFKGLTKEFPGVKALDNIDFAIREGETHVLVGENGAGKSTLVNIVTGAIIPEQMELMKFDGKEVSFANPSDALKMGIGAVRQHFSLVPDMTVAENIFLNREILKNRTTIDFQKMKAEAIKIINDLGVPLSPNTLVKDLNPGDKQIVEICKAISLNPKLLLMDEPTSGLKHNEIKRLFEIIDKLKKRGVTILYISHRLEEIFEIGEWITVLRNGKKIADCSIKELDHKKLTKLIIGREMGKEFPKENVDKGDVILNVKNIGNSSTQVEIKDISFEIREGEILGIYGILGSGKEAIAQSIFGIPPIETGHLEIENQPCTIKNPKEAIKNKIGYLTDDRSKDGLMLGMSVKQNQTIASLKRFSVWDYILKDKEIVESDHYIKELGIKTPHREFMVKNLSGGNQQKVVLSKWLTSQARILIVNEPTKGVDIGAKVEMFRMMVEQAQKKNGILFISSELDEIVGMSDRILVMRNGKIVGEFKHGEVTEDELLHIATKQEEFEEAINSAKSTRRN